MISLKKFARHAFFKVHSLTAGLINQVEAPVIVLAYHRVTSLSSDPQKLAVDPKHFREQLQCITRVFDDIVRFDVSWPKSNKPSICLTFDDGYADNLLEALPLLEEYCIPATFFISTGHVLEGRWFWWDVLDTIFSAALPLEPCPVPGAEELHDPHALYRLAHTYLIGLSPRQQLAALDSLLVWASVQYVPSEKYRPLTVKEVQTLARHPLVTLGGHTHNHPRLAVLDATSQRLEISRCLDLLEEWTGKRPLTLAYPFGSRSPLGRYSDYNADSAQCCRELNIIRAAANYPGQVRSWTNPYSIPRHLVRDWKEMEFSGCLKSFLTAGCF